MEVDLYYCRNVLVFTKLVGIEEIMMKESYLQFLIKHVIPSGKRLLSQNFVIQQDNDSKHISNLCKNYLEQKKGGGNFKI